jgi:hypothetical protein
LPPILLSALRQAILVEPHLAEPVQASSVLSPPPVQVLKVVPPPVPL